MAKYVINFYKCPSHMLEREYILQLFFKNPLCQACSLYCEFVNVLCSTIDFYSFRMELFNLLSNRLNDGNHL